ncbi:MAG: hypothetical protein K2P90_03015 [Holosporales bacterium]|nr:hypothetical protein [Holosporales bacterium]
MSEWILDAFFLHSYRLRQVGKRDGSHSKRLVQQFLSQQVLPHQPEPRNVYLLRTLEKQLSQGPFFGKSFSLMAV